MALALGARMIGGASPLTQTMQEDIRYIRNKFLEEMDPNKQLAYYKRLLLLQDAQAVAEKRRQNLS